MFWKHCSRGRGRDILTVATLPSVAAPPEDLGVSGASEPTGRGRVPEQIMDWISPKHRLETRLVLASAVIAGGGRRRRDRGPCTVRRELLQRQDPEIHGPVRRRRRLRRLRTAAGATPRRSHPRQAAHRDREHAGRQRRRRHQLALQHRSARRHRHGLDLQHASDRAAARQTRPNTIRPSSNGSAR